MMQSRAKGFISYCRVSTQRQGQSGLGLDAQRVAVANYVAGRGEILVEFVEVESGRKGANGRPQLVSALDACKRAGAALVIGKLDRLARDVRFFLEVIDDSGVDIRFADLPDVSPSSDEGRMILVSMANFAEFEGRRISTRTKAALAAAKARGVVLGSAGRDNLKPRLEERKQQADAYALRLEPLVTAMRSTGLSQRGLVSQLNTLGIPAPQGGAWTLVQVQRVLTRLAVLASVEEVARDAEGICQ
jgi:DNA invertase Pin-like site-specific DNA recombinase